MAEIEGKGGAVKEFDVLAIPKAFGLEAATLR
jgi:hypothetical protein